MICFIFPHHYKWKCLKVRLNGQQKDVHLGSNVGGNSKTPNIGCIYTRRRLRRLDGLNVWLLSASVSASCFYTRRLKRLRRLIHLGGRVVRSWVKITQG